MPFVLLYDAILHTIMSATQDSQAGALEGLQHCAGHASTVSPTEPLILS